MYNSEYLLQASKIFHRCERELPNKRFHAVGYTIEREITRGFYDIPMVSKYGRDLLETGFDIDADVTGIFLPDVPTAWDMNFKISSDSKTSCSGLGDGKRSGGHPTLTSTESLQVAR